jgi:hypothetical protein
MAGAARVAALLAAFPPNGREAPPAATLRTLLLSGGGASELLRAGLPGRAPAAARGRDDAGSAGASEDAGADGAAGGGEREFFAALLRCCDGLSEDADSANAAADARVAAAARLLALLQEGRLEERCVGAAGRVWQHTRASWRARARVHVFPRRRRRILRFRTCVPR